VGAVTRTVRLVTHDGFYRELRVPSLKLTMRVVVDRTFIGLDPSAGGFVFERTTERRFEHHHGTGLGDDVAVYEEVATR
jgi:hypothetical protein